MSTIKIDRFAGFSLTAMLAVILKMMEAELLILSEHRTSRIPMTKSMIRIGSNFKDDVRIDAGIGAATFGLITWSAQHGGWLLTQAAGNPVLISIDGNPLPSGRQFLLRNESLISIGGTRCLFRKMLATPKYNGNDTEVIDLSGRPLVIGRASQQAQTDEANHTLELDGECLAVSRIKPGSCHAKIEKEGEDYFLSDCSTGGNTFINGKGFAKVKLVFGDQIKIDDYAFEFTGKQIRRTEPSRLGTIEARNIRVTVKDRNSGLPKDILDVARFSIASGEFIGILGGSGQGKSTLLKALCGIIQPNTGSVTIGGISLANQKALRDIGVGYVPQEDIVHPELTITQALYYAGRLRLNLPERELRSLATRVMELLSLTDYSEKKVAVLSGGQRKRVSIAIELLARPSVLFLDEPSSGLDLQTESELMDLLQQLTFTGLTVLCTTHVLQQAQLFNRLAWVHDGRVIFLGTVDEARDNFLGSGTGTHADTATHRGRLAPLQRIYQAVMTGERTAREWESLHLTSNPPVLLDAERDGTPVRKSSFAEVRQVGPFRALNTLLARQWAVLIADPLNLVFLLAQAAAIALLVAWVSSEVELRMFLGLIAVLWFGCSNGAQQIVSELPTFRRERVCGLGLNTYLFSKLAFVSATTLVQAGILFFVMLTSAVLIRPPFVDLNDVRSVVKAEFPKVFASNESKPPKIEDLGRITRCRLWLRNYQELPEFVPGSELEPVRADGKNTAKAALIQPDLPPGWVVAPMSWLALLLDSDSNFTTALRDQPLDHSDELTSKSYRWAQALAGTFGLRIAAIVLAAVVGVSLGLLVSALVRTPTQSVMWVPLLMIPQILLGGYVITSPEMPNTVRVLSQIIPSFATERINQVSLIFGLRVPPVTNETKLPSFILSDHPEKIRYPNSDGKEIETAYDRLSPFNKAWQNLIVDPVAAGRRPLEKPPSKTKRPPTYASCLDHTCTSFDPSRGYGTSLTCPTCGEKARLSTPPPASNPKMVSSEPRIDIRFRFRHQNVTSEATGSTTKFHPRFDEINEAQTSMLILGLWILACYGIALGGIWSKRSS